MKLDAAQCSAVAQVLPTLLVVLIAERYFGLGQYVRKPLIGMMTGAAMMLTPVAIAGAVLGSSHGATGVIVLYIYAIGAWLLALVTIGSATAILGQRQDASDA